MRLIIDCILIFILAVCTWLGYKQGIIRSLLGLIALIVALVLANLLATEISKQIVPALEPFASGYIDSESTTQAVLERLGYGDSDKSLDDIIQEDSSLRYDYAYETLRETGFFRAVSEDLAKDCVSYADKNNISMTDSVITVVCNSGAYVLCLTVLFVMIIVLFTAILEMLNLNVHLQKAPEADALIGAVIGLIKGIFLCILLSWMLGFLGLVIGKDTADKGLMSFFLGFRFLTRTLI